MCVVWKKNIHCPYNQGFTKLHKYPFHWLKALLSFHNMSPNILQNSVLSWCTIKHVTLLHLTVNFNYWKRLTCSSIVPLVLYFVDLNCSCISHTVRLWRCEAVLPADIPFLPYQLKTQAMCIMIKLAALWLMLWLILWVMLCLTLWLMLRLFWGWWCSPSQHVSSCTFVFFAGLFGWSLL